MTNEEIDNLSKAAFPPSDNVAYDAKYWDNMEAMLGPSPKRKGFIFWWGTGAVLLMLGGLAALSSNWFSNSSKVGIVENYQPRTTTEVASLISEKSTEEPLLTEPYSVSVEEGAGQQVINNENAENEHSPNSHLENKDNLLQENEVLQPVVSNPKKSNSDGPVTENLAVGLDDNNSINEKLSKTEANQKPTSEMVTTHATEQAVTGKVASSESFVEEERASENQLSANDNSGGTENSGINSNENPLLLTSAGDIKLMTFKEFNSFKLMNDFELIDCCDETLPVNTTEFGEPIETKKTRSFFVELEGGMARFSKNEISISNNSEKILTVDPSPIREWNMGVNVGVKKGNWYLFSGINYHEFTQKFNTQIRSMDSNLSISYNQRQETQYFETFVRNIVSKVPNGSGFSYELTGTEYKSDTVLVNVTDTVFDWSEVEVTESEKQEYRTQYLQIPLAIGYTHSIKSKWLLEGFVRTDIGFLMNQKGTYYNETDETFYPLNESSNASKITFSCQLGVGVGYRLTDAMSIQIRPSYRQILKGPFDSDNYNRSGVGVNAAIRFKL